VPIVVRKALTLQIHATNANQSCIATPHVGKDTDVNIRNNVRNMSNELQRKMRNYSNNRHRMKIVQSAWYDYQHWNQVVVIIHAVEKLYVVDVFMRMTTKAIKLRIKSVHFAEQQYLTQMMR